MRVSKEPVPVVKPEMLVHIELTMHEASILRSLLGCLADQCNNFTWDLFIKLDDMGAQYLPGYGIRSSKCEGTAVAYDPKHEEDR